MLIAAKVAAEVAERIGLPAVVGEILVGVLIGPSAFGLVGGEDEVLRVLGEIGVILLLLEVGLQMDLKEMATVGRAASLVALVGVAAPLILGWSAASALGHDGNAALFVAAALTATSVGITARVFGDLRALASPEARTVVGAAVVDDVLGLVILTVVVRITTEGSVSALTVAGVVGLAVGFLVATWMVGVRVAPPLFRSIHASARSAGTLVAIALAFTLGFAELARVAKLAPIVGAFVAGLALARSAQAERIRRELTPVGHLFIPVFFLQIGIDAHVSEFVDVKVLALAGALLVVAIVGKLVAAIGAIGSKGDKLLIGVGMLPRGEVGLIFAGIGLRQGVLGQDLYAALLLVVLVTTLVAPPVLRWRLRNLRGEGRARAPAPTPRPEGGWLHHQGETVELHGQPGDHLALHLALEAALATVDARPGPKLLDWLATTGEVPVRWDREATRLLFRVLRQGNVRSWRFLEASGILERALPELDDTLRRRRADPFELDPSNLLRWSLVDRVQELVVTDKAVATEYALLDHPDWLHLAALVLETAGSADSPVECARRLVKRLDLGAAAEQEIALLVGDSGMLRAASGRADGLTEDAVLPVALHLDRRERARALYLLSVAIGDLDSGERRRLDELHRLVQTALSHEELTGRQARNLIERRRTEASRHIGPVVSETVSKRLTHAPPRWLLSQGSADIARQVQFVDPVPRSGRARVAVTVDPVQANGTAGHWRVEVVCRDRRGLLAVVTGVLGEAGLDVTDASLATWPDGAALESFGVQGREPPAVHQLEKKLEQGFDRPVEAGPVEGAVLVFDNEASPWYTLCDARAPDQAGLLHSMAASFAAAGADVHTAAIATAGGTAIDRFELTGPTGEKVDPLMQEAIRAVLAEGATLPPTRGWWGIRSRVSRS